MYSYKDPSKTITYKNEKDRYNKGGIGKRNPNRFTNLHPTAGRDFASVSEPGNLWLRETANARR